MALWNALRGSHRLVFLAAAAAAALLLSGHGKPARISWSMGNFDVVISQVHHEARHNGRLEWMLDAEAAGYSESGQDARLEDIRMVFFGKNGDKVFVSADQGRVNMRSEAVFLSGSVKVHDRSYTLTTKELEYNAGKKLIWSRTPVSIRGMGMRVSGDSMDYYLEKRKAVLRGDVRGSIGENGAT